MGVPAIVGADESILTLAAGTTVILNGNDGRLMVEPNAALLEQATQEQARWLDHRRAAGEQANLPAVTIDDRHIDVTANAGSAKSATEAVKMGADGIGLLRTEFLFLDRATAPTDHEQFDVYRQIARRPPVPQPARAVPPAAARHPARRALRQSAHHVPDDLRPVGGACCACPAGRAVRRAERPTCAGWDYGGSALGSHPGRPLCPRN